MIEQKIRIGDTPMSISVYSVENMPTKKNKQGTLEIIFCLKGSVLFSYAYEEFTLHTGEFILVDTDAFFFRKGKDNICVSFYLDSLSYKDKYQYIDHEFFVCEGTPETDVTYYPSINHERIKGLLLTTLSKLCVGDYSGMQEICDNIMSILVNHFDIVYYHCDTEDISHESVQRVKHINHYLVEHMNEKITLKDVAVNLGITEGYLSAFMRKMSIGFKGMLAYVRANASEDLLLNTDKNIIEISEECGFSDVKYYYSAFKKWYRCTPKQFRERYGQVRTEDIEYLTIADTSEAVQSLMVEHYREVFIKDIFEK